MAPILLEICCGSAEDAIEAAAGGADRVELCSALFLGGLTPSLGSLLEAKQRTNIPVIAMNRPRPAGFCYSATEFAVMERDAELLLEHGADGIVFGMLNGDGTIDMQAHAGNFASVSVRARPCFIGRSTSRLIRFARWRN